MYGAHVSIPAQLGNVGRALLELLAAHVQLFKEEAAEEATALGTALAAFGLVASSLWFGWLFLSFAVLFALVPSQGFWLAALWVGGTHVLLAVLVGWITIRWLKSRQFLVRTRASLEATRRSLSPASAASTLPPETT